jgi:four helix bundle protein
MLRAFERSQEFLAINRCAFENARLASSCGALRGGPPYALEQAMAKHFSELAAWQLAVELRDTVHALTDNGPARTDRDFYNDIRDVASSVPNNVAEGHVRFGPADNRRFLGIARSSLAETQNRLLEGRERKFWSDDAFHQAWRLSSTGVAALHAKFVWLYTFPRNHECHHRAELMSSSTRSSDCCASVRPPTS